MTASEAARTLATESALQRRSREREPVLANARAMRAAMQMPDAPALCPPLVLTGADRI